MTETISAPTPILTCVAGSDSGKRIAFAEARATVGRAGACNLVSDDAELSEQHLAVFLRDGEPYFEAISGSVVFLDGHAAASGRLQPGHQLRFGRSYWQLAPSAPSAPADESLTVWVDRVSGQISAVAGVERIHGLSPAEMFSEVLKKHDEQEVEEYFMVGSPRTTPPLAAVDDRWPRPWVFVRVMTLSLLVYAGFVFAFEHFDYNILLLPGLITVGSFAIPLSMLLFYFEMNAPRNVSLYQLFKTFLIGGIISIVLALSLFKITKLDDTFGPPSAGLIEEVGKAAALLLLINRLRYRWILNGLLLGAAVGTGFAAFESAGYALLKGLVENDGGGFLFDPDLIVHNINTRGMLTLLGGHVIWTGLVGAALWRVRGDQRFRWEMLKDMRFLRVLALAMSLHALWNSKIPETLYLKYFALGFVGWVATLSYIQAGLKQVRDERAKLAAAPLTGTTMTTPPGAATEPVIAAAAPASSPEPHHAKVKH